MNRLRSWVSLRWKVRCVPMSSAARKQKTQFQNGGKQRDVGMIRLFVSQWLSCCLASRETCQESPLVGGKKMKSLSNDSNNNHNNSWLGFSLSPHMNMDVPSDPHHHHQTQPPPTLTAVSTPVSTGFFPSPSHLNYSGIYYGVEGENGGFYSPLSVMPLKSDGSLCIMEALSRSQPQG